MNNDNGDERDHVSERAEEDDEKYSEQSDGDVKRDDNVRVVNNSDLTCSEGHDVIMVRHRKHPNLLLLSAPDMNSDGNESFVAQSSMERHVDFPFRNVPKRQEESEWESPTVSPISRWSLSKSEYWDESELDFKSNECCNQFREVTGEVYISTYLSTAADVGKKEPEENSTEKASGTRDIKDNPHSVDERENNKMFSCDEGDKLRLDKQLHTLFPPPLYMPLTRSTYGKSVAFNNAEKASLTAKRRKDRKDQNEVSLKLCPVRQRSVSEGAAAKNQPQVTLKGDDCRENDNDKAPPLRDVYFVALKPPVRVLQSNKTSPEPAVATRFSSIPDLPGLNCISSVGSIQSPICALRKRINQTSIPVRNIWENNCQRATHLMEGKRKRCAAILSARARRMEERERKKEKYRKRMKVRINPIIIPADHRLKIVWDVFTVILTFVSTVRTHHSIRDRTYEHSPFVIFMECWFLLDILLNFITEHKTSDGQIIRDGKAVWARYLTGWFVVDALSLVPWEHIYVKPIVEMHKRRNIFKRTFFRSKAVVKVSRIIRGRHIKIFGRVVSKTKKAGVGASRLLHLIIKYLPKYIVFYRNMRSVLVVRTLRQIHFLRKVSTGLWVTVREKKKVLDMRARERRRRRMYEQKVLQQFVKAASQLADMNRAALKNSQAECRLLLRSKKQYLLGGDEEDIEKTVDTYEDEDTNSNCDKEKENADSGFNLADHIGELDPDLGDSMDNDSMTVDDSVDLNSIMTHDSFDYNSLNSTATLASLFGDDDKNAEGQLRQRASSVVGMYDENEDDIFLHKREILRLHLSPRVLKKSLQYGHFQGKSFTSDDKYGICKRGGKSAGPQRRRQASIEDDGDRSIDYDFFSPIMS